jgi:hypothetical protein
MLGRASEKHERSPVLVSPYHKAWAPGVLFDLFSGIANVPRVRCGVVTVLP